MPRVKHGFEVGDTVWINELHRDYADHHYGSYYGPFIIVKFEWNEGAKKQVTRLQKPGGPELKTGAFSYRLRPDVFMTAARKAVKSA